MQRRSYAMKKVNLPLLCASSENIQRYSADQVHQILRQQNLDSPHFVQ